jgi:hypothetical protein
MFRRIAFALTLASVPVVAATHADAASGAYVTPTISCVISGLSSNTYWFGYVSTDPQTYRVPVGTGNVVSLSTGGSINRGQVTQFLPGNHPLAFAVNVPFTSSATWRVSTPNAVAVSTATIGAVRPCPAGVPTWSATTQSVSTPTIGLQVSTATDGLGHLTSTSWNLAVSGITSSCSSGGTPLPPTYVYGYNDENYTRPLTMAAGYARNLAVLQPTNVVGSVIAGTSNRTFTLTSQSGRTVSNVQRSQTVYGVSSGYVTNRGFAFTTYIINAYARCQFGAKVLTGTEPMWAEGGGGVQVTTATVSRSNITFINGKPIVTTYDAVQVGASYAYDGVGGGGGYHR